MKILIANQLKEADKFTIENEPIASIDLMERASKAIAEWFLEHVEKSAPLLFLIGKGNNGGDGLAVARMLHGAGYKCSVCLPFDESALSEENLTNLKRLPDGVSQIAIDEINRIANEIILVDALLGTGLRGEIKEPLASLICKINALDRRVISIDLPSGMKSEFGNKGQSIVKADITLALEFPKLATLLPEAGGCCGEIVTLPIGLDKRYLNSAESPYHFTTEHFIKSQLKKREKFGHKNTYGHALLVCGSRGMMGAAVLATGGALRSGCGLLTVHLPENERAAVQAGFPSAILSLDEKNYFSKLPENLEKYNAIGMGCGLGQAEDTKNAFEKLLKSARKPLVLDADALNILAKRKDLIKHIPRNSILTPHLGELKRLIGEWKDEEEKITLVVKLSGQTQSVVLVKGAYSMIVLPDGSVHFNPTGNSGMAKGGSGDVLAGFITGLLARGYPSGQAAILGTYFHGLAGDKAAGKYGQESMNSFDLIDFLTI